MKKFCVALVTAMVLAVGCLLVGCSEESPTDVTKAYLDALKSKDSEVYSQVYGEDGSKLFSGDSSNLTDEQKKVMSKMVDKMLDFDYTIDDETIDGKTAKVDVTIKTYKFGKAFTKAAGDYLEKAVAKALVGDDTDEDELADLMWDCYSKQLDKLKSKDYEKTVTFNLTQTNDGWTLDNLTDEQTNALVGGFVDELKELSSSAGSESSSK